ncbi:hypothetical protein BDZ97DRAFT_1265260 [Flammula alnicola]|nr:hypothetical protein BDZ97DRAFT_1265260 [Flammula alnicola]
MGAQVKVKVALSKWRGGRVLWEPEGGEMVYVMNSFMRSPHIPCPSILYPSSSSATFLLLLLLLLLPPAAHRDTPADVPSQVTDMHISMHYALSLPALFEYRRVDRLDRLCRSAASLDDDDAGQYKLDAHRRRRRAPGFSLIHARLTFHPARSEDLARFFSSTPISLTATYYL